MPIGTLLSDLVEPGADSGTDEAIWAYVPKEPGLVSAPVREDTNAFDWSSQPTCDVCTAGQLISDGVLPSKLTAEQLHATCRNPGTCGCGCDWSRGVRCANCGRTRTAADGYIARPDGSFKCTDDAGCAAHMLRAVETAPKPRGRPKKVST